jgi:LuxR family transcriptional regulator, quorum-sensing system regulator CciR
MRRRGEVCHVVAEVRKAMGQFQDVQAFVDKVNRVSALDDLEALIDGAARELGFDFYALTHHVEIAARPSQLVRQLVRLSNYPAAWAARVVENRYFLDDPIHAACQKTGVGFRWSDLPDMIALTDRHRLILDSAMREGLGHGFTVPVHVPGEFAGSASFGMARGRDLNDASLPAAQYLGCFGFEAARRIVQSTRTDPEASPSLTKRQLDCVVLVARGKSDWDAAQILGLAPDTVHQHVEAAKKRYSVASRTQLVVRALFDSRITFSDIL